MLSVSPQLKITNCGSLDFYPLTSKVKFAESSAKTHLPFAKIHEFYHDLGAVAYLPSISFLSQTGPSS